jgi:MFS transporter, ACS family, hexuronate transporter
MHKTQTEIGHVLWIPPLGWECGYFFWGWILDKFPRGASFVPALRKLAVLLTVLTLPLALVPRTDSFAGVLALLFFAMFISAGFVIAAMAYVTRIFSVKSSGLIAGLGAGTWSLVVALLAPRFGRLFDLKQYGDAFLLAVAAPVLGLILFSVLSRDGARTLGHTPRRS